MQIGFLYSFDRHEGNYRWLLRNCSPAQRGKKINVSNFILLYSQCFPPSLSEAWQACVRWGAVSVFRSSHSTSDSLHEENEQKGAVGNIGAGTPPLCIYMWVETEAN